VVGYDDSLARTVDPPLTSVRQPVEEMGREMTRLLVQAIEEGGSVPRRVVLGTDLVVRRSSGRTAGA
jgi:DNA-binding LacI/PurR family transcriptional regulator